MFRKKDKNKNKAGIFAVKQFFGGKGKNNQKEERDIENNFSLYVNPPTDLRSIDSDYGDSRHSRPLVIDDDSHQAEIYADTDTDTEPNMRRVDSEESNKAVIVKVKVKASPTNGPSTPVPRIEPMVVTPISEEETPVKELSNDERKARARRAVEERKKKSRSEIAARKARAAGGTARGTPPLPDAVDPPEQHRDVEVPLQDHEGNRRRAVSEERHRLLEQERQNEQEEREALEREEAEMRELEEALKKEEEEAKKLAEQYDTIKETVEVETVDIDELEEEETEAFVSIAESPTENSEFDSRFDDANRAEEQQKPTDSEKAELEAEFAELARMELEAEAELAQLHAEQFNAEGDETGKNANDLLNQFVTLDEDEEAIDFVDADDDDDDDDDGVVNRSGSVQLPDLDDLLDGSLSFNESTILDEVIEGPIKFTKLSSKSTDKKKKSNVVPKNKDSFLRRGSKSNAGKLPVGISKKPNRKPPVSRTIKSKPPQVNTKTANKPKTKPIVPRTIKPKLPQTKKETDNKPKKKPIMSRYLKKKTDKKPTLPTPLKPKPPQINKKPPLSMPVKPKPPQTKKKPTVSVSKSPISVPPKINMSHFRPLRKNTAIRGPSVAESGSIDSMGSQCTFSSMPQCPYVYSQVLSSMPICNNKYIVDLHAKPSGCQVCIFKLSEVEKAMYEKNGRHLRVASTTGGCQGCMIFPSADGEDPVRICKKCFFDTHLIKAYKKAAFAGSGSLTGVQKNSGAYSLNRRKSVSGASVS